MRTSDFFAINPVFSLEEAAKTLAPGSPRSTVVERLKHHLGTSRLQLVTREIYAVIPAGSGATRFRPDPFLVAAAMRPEGVFSHHSALELLGAAHSAWNRTTLYTSGRRRVLKLEGGAIQFLEHPSKLASGPGSNMGTVQVERKGKLLRATGPERTLVESFRRPSLSGGVEEIVLSASGFASLDLKMLQKILNAYGSAHLWAAAGWFLERFQATFGVPDKVLERMAEKRPPSPQYLVRGRRGGSLAKRWNLIIPETVLRMEEPDEA